MDQQISAIIGWVGSLAELRDDTTGKHNENVQRYLKVLIEKTGGKQDMDDIMLASVLHDVGKIRIPDSILLKRGRLTEREFELMKKHCQFGKELLESLQSQLDLPFLEYAKVMAYYHHEKWDGTGYPEGLKGGAIPLEARLISLVDVYDVLLSQRPYKPAFPHEQALELIVEGRGTHFDPELVDLFVSMF